VNICVAFLIPIMILYMWWLLANNIHKSSTVWAFVVIIGMLYVLAASLVNAGHYVFASVLVILNFVFMITITAVSGMSDEYGKSGLEVWFLGTLPFILGLMFAFLTSYMCYKSGALKFG